MTDHQQKGRIQMEHLGLFCHATTVPIDRKGYCSQDLFRTWFGRRKDRKDFLKSKPLFLIIIWIAIFIHMIAILFTLTCWSNLIIGYWKFKKLWQYWISNVAGVRHVFSYYWTFLPFSTSRSRQCRREVASSPQMSSSLKFSLISHLFWYSESGTPNPYSAGRPWFLCFKSP